MKLKRILSLIMVTAMVLASVFAFTSCNNEDAEPQIKVNPDKQEYVVGICQLVQHDALDAATQGFKDALTAALAKEGRTVKFEEGNAQNDSTICTTIVNDFVNKDVDLILANATAPLQSAYNATTTIPVLGTSITDYGSALNINNWTGIAGGNVSGTTDLAPLDQQVEMIVELYPNVKKVGLIYCSAEPNSEYQVTKVAEYLTAKGIAYEKFSFSDSNDVAASSARAAASSDVLYVPTDNTAAAYTGSILGAIGNKPLIAGEEGICSGCGVATLSIDYYDLGVTTGEMAAKILLGQENISEMPVQSAAEFTKKYNKARCEELGVDTAALEAKGYVAIQ
ncbi:MAG: ABC transporter substrate-binding protein [Clostridia bacterium]|nr:ABC transporter substrate-binding protein [Clostridia bacterium]